ncbi:MAG: hypothetical protein ACXVCE_08090, partial [Bacteriovorax sp.]
LFKENNDLAVLKKIQECKVPVPSSINPNVPKELDEIVLKALSKDRTKRFENLDQMNRALMKFLYAKFPDFNATDLSYFSQELFRDEIKKDREKMFEFGKIDIRPYLDELKKEAEGGSRNSEASTSVSIADGSLRPKEKEQILDFGFNDAKEKSKKTQTVKRIGSSSAKEKPNMATGDITASHAVSDLTKSTMTSVKPGQTKSTVKKMDGTKTKIIKNELKSSSPKKKNSAATIAALFAVVVGSAAYLYYSQLGPKERHPVMAKNEVAVKERQPAQVHQDASANVAKQDLGNLVLSHFDKQKMQVFIDGHNKEVDLLSSIKVPLGKEFTLRVQIEGKKHFIKEMRVDNSSAVEVEVPEMPAIAYGYVSTSSNCAQGEIRFELYGEKRMSPIPMVETFGIAFPLGIDEKGQLTPQTYQLFFKKKGEDIERKIEITLNREDQTIDLCEQL